MTGSRTSGRRRSSRKRLKTAAGHRNALAAAARGQALDRWSTPPFAGMELRRLGHL